MKKTISGIMSVLLLIGMLTLTFDISTVKANARIVGVEVGDWARYDVAFSWTGTLPPHYEDTKNVEWVIIEVTAISGTVITFDGTLHFKNGTENTTTGLQWDVDPPLVYLPSMLWFIGAELEAGDVIYPYSGWLATINETETRTYAGVPREVNHFTGTVLQYYYHSFMDCYWDKETGILVEQTLEQYLLATSTDTISISIVIVETNIWSSTYIPATVDVTPESLNLRSRGKWITAYIELPSYNINDINVSSIMLDETVPAEPKPKAIGDYDNDTVPDLMVKFNRAEVESCIRRKIYIIQIVGIRYIRMTISLTITGYLNDGTPFEGTDTITIFWKMPRWMRLEILGTFSI